MATGLWPDGPNCRGWSLAPLVHLGDVIEFGADAAAAPCRWYGYVVHADDVSLTLVGPFDSPNDAADDGSDSLPTWQAAHAGTLLRRTFADRTRLIHHKCSSIAICSI